MEPIPDVDFHNIDELRALHRVAMRLQHIFDAKLLAEEFIRVLEETLGYEHAAILVIDKVSELLIPFAISDQAQGPQFVQKDIEYIRSQDIHVGHGITGWVAAHGKTIRSADVRKDDRYIGIRDDIVSELCVPMWNRGQVIGVINIETDVPDAYSESDQRILEITATQIGVAIENNKLHEALVHSQKMDAIGRLTSGISHDFNNLLTVINGFTEIMLDRDDLDVDFRRYLKQIELAGTQAAEITHRLLAFSRKSVLQPTLVDPNEQIEKLSHLISRVLNSNVEFQMELGVQVGTIEVDQTQFSQVLMNLASNASDSMPEGGTFTIATSSFISDTDVQFGSDSTISRGSYTLLTISDTGVGMSEETQRSIFQPFFSTKPSGTGLGMSMVSGIVQQLGGQIRVSSTIGGGSVFKIYLPVVDSASQIQRDTAMVSPVPSAGSCLVVEDEEMVRNLVVTFVESLGFSVHSAASGTQAFEFASNPNCSIDLIISDIMMPEQTGPSLVKLLRELHPDAKVLYMSGYPADSLDSNGVFLEKDQLISKPFTLATFKQKVAEVCATT